MIDDVRRRISYYVLTFSLCSHFFSHFKKIQIKYFLFSVIKLVLEIKMFFYLNKLSLTKKIIYNN